MMDASPTNGAPAGAAARLPRNARRVWEALRRADRPMTAYDLLDALRADGVSAPLTVYRALRRLIADGLAHRLESLNAYVVCARPGPGPGTGSGDGSGDGSHGGSHGGSGDGPDHGHAPAFLVCEGCGAVDEIEDRRAVGMLTSDARRKGYAVTRMAVEMIGACEACRAASERG